MIIRLVTAENVFVFCSSPFDQLTYFLATMRVDSRCWLNIVELSVTQHATSALADQVTNLKGLVFDFLLNCQLAIVSSSHASSWGYAPLSDQVQRDQVQRAVQK